jgi:hypothetical protein
MARAVDLREYNSLSTVVSESERFATQASQTGNCLKVVSALDLAWHLVSENPPAHEDHNQREERAIVESFVLRA